MMRMRLLGSAGACALAIGFASPASAQSFEGVITAFDVLVAIVSDDVTLPTLGDEDSTATITAGGRDYVVATVDASPLEELLDNAETQQQVELLVDGDLITVSTDAADFGSLVPTSEIRVEGTVENTRVEVEYTGDLDELSSASVLDFQLNGEAVTVTLPTDTDLTDLDGTTPVSIVVDGDEVYSGTVDDLEDNDVVALEVANSVNTISTVTTLGFEVQQVQQGRAIGTSRSRISGVFHTPGGPSDGMMADLYGAFSPNEQLAMAEGGASMDVLGGSVAQADRFGFGEAATAVWVEVDYTDFSNDDPAFRSDGEMVSFTVGADALFDDQYLLGVSVGYDTLDADGGGSLNNSLEMDAFNLSLYGAGALADGMFIPEAALNIAILNVDTGTSTGASGETDGYSIVGRVGATAQREVFENAVVGAFGGLELGYQELDGFTDSQGVVTDTRETPLGEFDLGIRGAVEAGHGLSVIGSAAYVFDFSDELDSDIYLDELSENYVELSAQAAWEATEQFTINVGGSTKLGMEDRDEFTIGGGASYRF